MTTNWTAVLCYSCHHVNFLEEWYTLYVLHCYTNKHISVLLLNLKINQSPDQILSWNWEAQKSILSFKTQKLSWIT
jgi:hypothetical protein